MWGCGPPAGTMLLFGLAVFLFSFLVFSRLLCLCFLRLIGVLGSSSGTAWVESCASLTSVSGASGSGSFAGGISPRHFGTVFTASPVAISRLFAAGCSAFAKAKDSCSSSFATRASSLQGIVVKLLTFNDIAPSRGM